MQNSILQHDELKELEIPNPQAPQPASAAVVNTTYPFSADQLVFLLNDDQWEEFTREWACRQKEIYELVVRLGGANDFGIDVACFKSDQGFQGEWENFQCKHYKNPLAPSDAIPEIGKILWHIFKGHVSAPKNYYFFAPKDCGPSLKKLLLDKSKLMSQLISDWEKQCSKSITSVQEIMLDGDFEAFVKSFDFGIFKYKPTHDVIEEHKLTAYHAVRFGGGLTERPLSKTPPEAPDLSESRYVEQLLDAYSDCGDKISDYSDLSKFPQYSGHFGRSREAFYEAEALHSFARDSVPNGTFENLQDEVLHGVKDVEEDSHDTAFKRVVEVTKAAGALNVQASGLHGYIKVKDLHGICHQLANTDKLVWKKS